MREINPSDDGVGQMMHFMQSMQSSSVNTAQEGAPHTVVLGIGNTLFADDGAGIAVVERLRDSTELPDGVSLVDGGTLNFTLLDSIENAPLLIIIDAAQLNAPAGTTKHFEDASMDGFLRRGGGASVHEVGLSDLCDMARLRGTLPARRILIAIQPETLDWRCSLSPAVDQAVGQAIETVVRLSRENCHESG